MLKAHPCTLKKFPSSVQTFLEKLGSKKTKAPIDLKPGTALKPRTVNPMEKINSIITKGDK